MQFSALTYRPSNLGDEIQTIAALQYLPTDVRLINRELLHVHPPMLPCKIILNGWFMHYPINWPPAKSLDPLLVSFHITESAARMVTGAGGEYLRAYSAKRKIGARDRATLALLQSRGIDSYLSGCLTLTLLPDKAAVRSDVIYAVDLDDEGYSHLAARTKLRVERVTHFPRVADPWQRVYRAEALLKRYQSAAAVVTSRLHATLPTMAMGTPVLMILSDPKDSRFGGLVEHVNHATKADFLADRVDFNFDDPPANPTSWRVQARELASACEAFTGIKIHRPKLPEPPSNVVFPRSSQPKLGF